jgi:hypothetical protein
VILKVVTNCDRLWVKGIKMDGQTNLIPLERIERAILCIRGQKVLLSQQLAELYGIETKVLNQAVARNRERFPDDFMFQLNKKEFENLKSQFVTSKWWRWQERNRSQAVTGLVQGHNL